MCLQPIRLHRLQIFLKKKFRNYRKALQKAKNKDKAPLLPNANLHFRALAGFGKIFNAAANFVQAQLDVLNSKVKIFYAGDFLLFIISRAFWTRPWPSSVIKIIRPWRILSLVLGLQIKTVTSRVSLCFSIFESSSIIILKRW